MIEIQKQIPQIRIFQRHVGLFYTKNKTPIKINQPGMSDLWAIYDNGHQLLHLEYEVKSGAGKQTKEQKNWQRFIESQHGIYLLVNDNYHVAIEQTKTLLSL